MGKPVRIYDLAVKMIELAGYKPNYDIEIKEIGLREGEKLYEELLIKGENLDLTDNTLIFIEKDKPFTREEVNDKISVLKSALDNATPESISYAFHSVVPTYKDPSFVNKNAELSEEMKMVESADA
jgi:FlaA1/EpsC-like NDP-sugar epimerase